jgi:hypothetical protein
MDLAVARLEDWMRRYYHKVDYDIGSSGVRDLTIRELREICEFELSELDSLIFHDSEPLRSWSPTAQARPSTWSCTRC